MGLTLGSGRANITNNFAATATAAGRISRVGSCCISTFVHPSTPSPPNCSSATCHSPALPAMRLSVASAFAALASAAGAISSPPRPFLLLSTHQYVLAATAPPPRVTAKDAPLYSLEPGKMLSSIRAGLRATRRMLITVNTGLLNLYPLPSMPPSQLF